MWRLVLGPVQLGGPMSRGAGDIAFVAPYVSGLVGVGILGEGYHAVGETAYLELSAESSEAECSVDGTARPATRKALKGEPIGDTPDFGSFGGLCPFGRDQPHSGQMSPP